MDPRSSRWKTITPSPHAHEREGLDLVRDRLPDREPYRAYANFELLTDEGRIYEVDLLVLTPAGLFLVELKGRPGVVTGDAGTWTWRHDGRAVSDDNPLLLANRKAKTLASLLARQKALKDHRLPFIVPVVFLTAEGIHVQLDAHARQGVAVRDRVEPAVPRAAATVDRLPGIIEVLCGQPDAGAEAADPALRRARPGSINAPLARALDRALDQAGIRPSTRSQRVQDYLLGPLLADGPGYQDFEATHVSVDGVRRRIRIFGVSRHADRPLQDELVRRAQRELRLLDGVRHPGILRAESYTVCERGPALIFEHDPKAIRLDLYLESRGATLDPGQRLELLRQIGEAIAHAHDQQLCHRALGPQSVLVREDERGRLRAQVLDWQLVIREGTRPTPRTLTGSVHPDELLEQKAHVYLAPESFTSPQAHGEAQDIFGLGALAYLLFGGRPPAATLLERHEKLRLQGGLQLAEAHDGVPAELAALVFEATFADVSERLEAVPSAKAFLQRLVQVEEELTAPEPTIGADPLQAKAGDVLAGGFPVERRLGAGSTAVVFRIQRDGERPFVLKVARSPDFNDRLREEGEVLQKLEAHRHQSIVAFRGFAEVGDRTGLLLAEAGTETLRDRIRRDGRLGLELLERFGDDLLSALVHLEEVGIAHRDIKPDNLGVAEVGKDKRLHLVLFDFSLSRAPLDQIRAGTVGYLEPFLTVRRPPRWDIHAERYAVTVTLYEMATGRLPRWGDDMSDPALVDSEVVIDGELFETSLRATLTAFFRRALRREVAERFDNAHEMRRAWREVFHDEAARGAPQSAAPPTTAAGTTPTSGAQPMSTSHDRRGALADLDPERLRAALATAAPATPLGALPLGARVQEALERAGAATIEAALRVPPTRIASLPAIGNRTRRSVRHALALFDAAFPSVRAAAAAAGSAERGRPAPVGADGGAAPSTDTSADAAGSSPPAGSNDRAEDGEAPGDAASEAEGPGAGAAPAADWTVAEVAETLLPSRGRGRSDERALAATRALLGWEPVARAAVPEWPSQSEVARHVGTSPGQVAKYVQTARNRWQKDLGLAAMRGRLTDVLAGFGGVASLAEVERALLAADEVLSGAPEPRPAAWATEEHPALARAGRAARAVARAAVEAERGRRDARFAVRRLRSGRIVLALEGGADGAGAEETLDWLSRLGVEADALAEQEPLPPPARVETALRAIASPAGFPPLSTERLVRVAAAASARAAVSSRLELYPRGLDAARALNLARGALIGAQTLTEEEVCERVRARYPEAERLPPRPALDDLLRAAGFELRWQEADAHADAGVSEAEPSAFASALPSAPGLLASVGGAPPPRPPRTGDTAKGSLAGAAGGDAARARPAAGARPGGQPHARAAGAGAGAGSAASSGSASRGRDPSGPSSAAAPAPPGSASLPVTDTDADVGAGAGADVPGRYGVPGASPPPAPRPRPGRFAAPPRGAYRLPTLVPTGLSSRSSLAPRAPTAVPLVIDDIPPEVSDARQAEDRLVRARRDGGFLAIIAAPRDVRRAERELARHGVRRVSFDALLLGRLRAIATAKGVRWPLVSEADAGGPAGRTWPQLKRLIGDAITEVEHELLSMTDPVLLTEVGLLARYDRVDLLERLRDRLSARTATAGVPLPGLWVLVAQDAQEALPLIDGRPVPVLGQSQWLRLPAAWLENRHRGAAAQATHAMP